MFISSEIKELIKSHIDFTKDKDYNINVIADALFDKDFKTLEKRHQKEVLKYYDDNYDRKGSW